MSVRVFDCEVAANQASLDEGCDCASIKRSIESGLNMTEAMASLIGTGAWKALEAHAAANRNLDLRAIFAQDPMRGERLKAEAAGIYLDYSKNRMSQDTIALLLQIAEG